MKKTKTLIVMVLLLCLTPLSLFAQYDNSPSWMKYVPSVIWAPASGDGTWSTELQIYADAPNAEVHVSFLYGGGSSRAHNRIWKSSADYDCFKTTNILSLLASRDPTFDYFGRSGALMVYTPDYSNIQVMARTYHSGGYAKTLCGLSHALSTTASEGRLLMIMNVMQSSSIRTAVTLFNIGTACTVNIQIIQNGLSIGRISKSLTAYDYQAFNVFTECGLTGTYDNCFVLIEASAGGAVFCSGATAHNSTNDPAYHVAQHWSQ